MQVYCEQRSQHNCRNSVNMALQHSLQKGLPRHHPTAPSQLVALQKALCFQVSILYAFNQLTGAPVAVHGACRARGRGCCCCCCSEASGRGLLTQSRQAKLAAHTKSPRSVARCASCASGWGGCCTLQCAQSGWCKHMYTDLY